ncbi:thiamine phosphate synthase [Prosthecomicrobium sp. N25]|uniref:thiamine phosphate synthase n=1 Tax=Prosthecomicrobium sp. N25 TaxID=3129254 RepID=UPI00307730DF
MRHLFDLRLYLVTDPVLAGPRGVVDTVKAAIEGGVTMVQLRDPVSPTRVLVEQARFLKQILAPRGIPLILNDRVDVALAADADGVHVGQNDMAPADVRRLLGPDRIVGLSVGSPVEFAASAGSLGSVDYLGTGPVRSTATKADAGAAIGPEGLAAVVRMTDLPVVAIGGIGLGEVAGVFGAGARGIAVVSAIMAATDPGAAARDLRMEVEKGRGGQP